MVRRLGDGLDHVPGLLPDRAAGGLRVLGPGRAPAVDAGAGEAAHRAAARLAGRAADHPGGALEAGRRREPVVADPGHAGRDDRAALLPAVDDQPDGAGVVLAGAAGSEPVPAVRAVEPGVDAGAGRLPVPARALGAHARAGDRLVGRLRALRRALRRRRLGEPAAPASAADRRRRERRRGPGARPRRAAADAVAAAPVVHARRDRVDPAARDLESHHPERRRGAAAVGRAARALPAHVHPLLRQHRLVQARDHPVDGSRGDRRDGLDAGRSRSSRTSSASRSACSSAGCSSRACSATANSSGSSRRRAGSRAST